MASNRHLGRIVALQTLFEYEFRVDDEPDLDLNAILARNLEQYRDAIGDTEFVEDLVHGVIKHQPKLDKIIGPAAPEWPIEQIARIDRAVLRVAIYELLIKKEVPHKVAINEAVELAKAFGGENSSKFVNGVLGTVYREHVGEPEKPSATKAKPAKKDASTKKKTDQTDKK